MSLYRGRYVFVGGLHRSGTSLLARMIADHPDVGAITGAPVPEQEGTYLQGAIPHTARHGIPGEFAYDPDQHLIEEGRFDSLETRNRLEADWARWYPLGTHWRVEKSPVNLLRTRLYQQLFPLAHFIIVARHPVAVAQATAKWSDRSLEDLVDHWGRAYELALADMEYLHHALIVRYEDLCASPDGQMARVFRFLGLDPDAAPPTGPLRAGNADYDERTDLGLPRCAATLGYARSLLHLNDLPHALACRHPLRDVREAVARSTETRKEPA